MSSEGKGAVHAEREASFLLAVPEKRLLRWLAARLPRWVLPDDMTALGVLAAFGVAVAYQLSNESLDWLWVASGLIALLVGRAFTNLRELARQEPGAPRR